MIRQILDKDIEAVVAIYNHYIENTVVSFEETLLGVSEMAGRVEKVLGAGFPWLVAEEEGEVQGYCYGFFWNTRSAYRHSAEVTVYLSPGATGRGVGTTLYEALFARLRKQGLKNVIGGIALPNPASVALHEKMGMTKVANFSKVGFKFDRWIDVGYWQGELQE